MVAPSRLRTRAAGCQRSFTGFARIAFPASFRSTWVKLGRTRKVAARGQCVLADNPARFGARATVGASAINLSSQSIQLLSALVNEAGKLTHLFPRQDHWSG